MAGQYLKMLPTKNFIFLIIMLTMVKISTGILILSPESFCLVNRNEVHLL